MRLVFVNYAHPEVRHVSAMRLFYFAKAMAARGHEVVLLTGASPEPGAKCTSSKDLALILDSHDWTFPLVLPVAEVHQERRKASTDRLFTTLQRKANTAWALAFGKGVYAGWVTGAMPVINVLAERFRPVLVWATFGNTSNLLLGQRLARRSHCQWVADVKDNWVAFVPRGLRKAVAWRFGDAVAITTNARLHMDVAKAWFGDKRAQIVYSGVADEFYQVRQLRRDVSAPITFALIGSTYSEDKLAAFIDAFRAWRVDTPNANVRLIYAGSDGKRVSNAASVAGIIQFLGIHGQLSIENLAVLLRQVTAVCYLGAETGFHHKLLELLVVGRPVLCFPHEHPESLDLASQSPTPFFVCKDRKELMQAFDLVCAQEHSTAAVAPPPAWRWGDMAVGLEGLFNEVLACGNQPCAA